MTMDLYENERKMSAYLTDRYAEIIERMGAHRSLRHHRLAFLWRRDHGD
jgi:hypothetical protein